MAYKKKDGKRPGVVLFYDWHESLEILAKNSGTAAVGNVILALLNYAEYGIIPDTLTDTEMMLFEIMRNRTDAAAEQYKERCERNALNGQKGGYTKAMNATTDLTKKQSYMTQLTAPRGNGNVMLMDGLYQDRTPMKTNSCGWKVVIPIASGGIDALTEDNTAIYRGQFPDIDLHDAALKWLDYLNATGRDSWPRYPRDEFESWLRKCNNAS